jgi:3D (Asp-Asp-Asp) domain-containing protein/septal ring factor EnvC (AmiA/AmiB activator)
LRVPSRFIGRGALILYALVCVALVCVALPASGGADRIGQLRSARASFAAQERAALLQLYALGSSLDRARGRLAAVQADLDAARRTRDTVQRQLGAARRTLAVADARLAAQLRAMYERDNPDVLSVLFGAASLDDVITGLDDVNRTTTSTRDLILQARAARARVAHALDALDRRTARLSRLRAAAADVEASIVSRQAERTAYIVSLRTKERLTGQLIADLESRARSAEAASTVTTIHAQAVKSLSGAAPARPAPPATRPPPAAPPPAAAPVQPTSGSGTRLTVVATAYSTHGGTASGLPTGPGVVAVYPTVIPLGTRMDIAGYGPGIAADTGTAIKGLRIDLWFPTLNQALSWGKRTVTITLR